MKTAWIIAGREYRRYFATPAAYAVAFFLFLVIGFIFYLNVYSAIVNNFGGPPPGLQIVINPLTSLLLFLSPAITMHLLTEEQHLGTIELMLTAPVRDWELVVGKWLGAFGFMATVVLSTIVYPLILNYLVTPGIDQGLLITSYLGLLFICSAFAAIGVAISSFFNSQVASFFTTIGFVLIIWLLNAPSQASGGNELLSYLGFPGHFSDTFFVGLIDIRDIVYYLSMTALFLFIGSTVVETRRWR